MDKNKIREKVKVFFKDPISQMIQTTFLTLKSGKNPQYVMLNLIYPAVLGTFIYYIFEWFYGHFNIIKFTSRDALLLLKVGLICFTLVFYYADFCYTKFTKQYNWLFFCFNATFTVILLITVKLIDLEHPLNPPDTFHICLAYCAFLSMYLVWDVTELARTKSGDEKIFYAYVIFWELVSIIIFAIIAFFDQLYDNSFFLLMLVPITISFVCLSLWKSRFIVP